MMNIMLRRTASVAAQRQTLAALASMEAVLHHRLYHFSSMELVAGSPENDVLGAQPRSSSGVVAPSKGLGFGNFGGVREFHNGSNPLEFRASMPASKGFAAADYFDEEKPSSSTPGGSGDEGLEISKLGISQDIVTALAKKGITKLFPIQKAVLEPAMQGRDMIGRARTGTGKTLAFGIPILDKIMKCNANNRRSRHPLALVLAPTRELAKQVDREFYDSAPNLETLCVYGGTPIYNQIRSLENGVDIVVGTPGRVIDLLKRRSLDLSEVQFVVLDEADQMLNVGFEEDVEKILENLPRKRQSLMFQQLCQLGLNSSQ